MVDCTPLQPSKFSTSTTNKKRKNNIEAKAKPATGRRHKGAADKIGDLSGISPIKGPPVNGATPAKTSRRKVVFEERNADKLSSRNEKVLRNKIGDLEAKLRRAENEISTAKARINSLRADIQEKDRHIRDLELRLPRVLKDISKGLGTKDTLTRRNNKEVKESMKRNHQLSQRIKELENKLEKKNGGEERRLKEENLRLKNECNEKERLLKENVRENLTKTREINRAMDAQAVLKAQCQQYKTNFHYIQGQLSQIEMEYKDKLSKASEENNYLYKEISDHYEELLKTEEDLKEMEKVIKKIISVCPEYETKVREAIEEKPFSPWVFNTISRIVNLTWPAAIPVNMEQSNLLEPLLGVSGADEADNLLDLGFAGGNSKSGSCGSSCCRCGSCSSKGSSIVEHNDSDEPNEAALIELDCSEDLIQFEDSKEETMFYSRVENLDLQLEILLNRLNSTTGPPVA